MTQLLDDLHHHLFLAIVAGGVLATACAPAPPREGALHQQIVNGVIDDGHPAVGIVHSAGSAACTGTLFASDQVVTAAHCVVNQDPPYNYLQPINFYIGGFYGTQFSASAVAAHPNYTGGGNDADVAVVWLGQAVQGVTPKPLAATAPSKGEPITLVGYGLVGEDVGEFGTKRKAINTIGDIGSQTISYFGASGEEGNICSGDSGGPSFAIRNNQEVLVGIHSTSSLGCTDVGNDMRVDAFHDWITTQQVDKKLYGGSCTGGADCASGLCITSDDGKDYCTQGCDTEPCPNFDQCVEVSGGGVNKACLPHSGGALGLGDSCEDNSQCSSRICVRVGVTGGVCSQKCTFDPDNCPSGYKCVASSVGGLCIPGDKPDPPDPPDPTKKKGMGEDCVSPTECSSGLCAPMGPDRFACSEWCDLAQNDCPTGYDCAEAAGHEKGVCVPPKKLDLGAACTDHDACASGLCVDHDDGRICAELCEADEDCGADGFECAPAAGGGGVCLPASDGCAVVGGGGPERAWPLTLLVVCVLLALGRRRR